MNKGFAQGNRRIEDMMRTRLQKGKDNETIFEKRKYAVGIFMGYQAIYWAILVCFKVYKLEIGLEMQKNLLIGLSIVSIISCVFFIRDSIKEAQNKWNGSCLVLLMGAIMTIYRNLF